MSAAKHPDPLGADRLAFWRTEADRAQRALDAARGELADLERHHRLALVEIRTLQAILAGLVAGSHIAVPREALAEAVSDLSEHSEPYGRAAIESAYQKLRALLVAPKAAGT